VQEVKDHEFIKMVEEQLEQAPKDQQDRLIAWLKARVIVTEAPVSPEDAIKKAMAEWEIVEGHVFPTIKGGSQVDLTDTPAVSANWWGDGPSTTYGGVHLPAPGTTATVRAKLASSPFVADGGIEHLIGALEFHVRGDVDPVLL
jgi:hypothetical protein